MLGKLIICKGCKEELQPEDIMVGVDKEGNLMRVCSLCGRTEIVEEKNETL